MSLFEQVTQHYVGRKQETRALLAALECGRNVFLEGPPGTSKSTVLGGIITELNRPLHRVVGNSDLTTAKLVGYFDPAMVMSQGYKAEYFEPGPLAKAMQDGGILYIEEFNRLPEDCANIFVSAISERLLPVPRLGTIEANDGFCIVAAMNSRSDIGTLRLSGALKDRFCSIKMNYQSKEEEVDIVRDTTKESSISLVSIAVEFCRRTRKHPDIRIGASVRGAIDLVMLMRNLIKYQDAESSPTEKEQLKFAARAALRDKITLNEVSQLEADDLIDEIWKGILDEWKVEHEVEWEIQLDPIEKKKVGKPA